MVGGWVKRGNVCLGVPQLPQGHSSDAAARHWTPTAFIRKQLLVGLMSFFIPSSSRVKGWGTTNGKISWYTLFSRTFPLSVCDVQAASFWHQRRYHSNITLEKHNKKNKKLRVSNGLQSNVSKACARKHCVFKGANNDTFVLFKVFVTFRFHFLPSC